MNQQRRNLLFIVVDQWRGDCLSRLDASWVKTPNLDALAERGVTFARHYCQSAPCGPARTSLLTGKYVLNHRVVHNGVPLDARHSHLGRLLREAGYDASLIGYTTTTPDPRTTSADDERFQRNGDIADSWRIYAQLDELTFRNYTAWVGGLSPEYAGKSAEDLWTPTSGARRPDGSPAVVHADLSDTAWSTDRALAFLRSRATDQPWALHLGYFRPHPPFTAPAPYHASTPLSSVPAPVRAGEPGLEAAGHPYLAHLYRTQPLHHFMVRGAGRCVELSDRELQFLRQSYYGLIEEVDRQIGRVIEYLAARKMLDNTLIVFTSDHGEQLGDHFLLGKLGFFDQSYHVPLIVADPSPESNATRGRVFDGLSESVDVLPTVLEWLGVATPHTCDGVSLLPQVHGDDRGKSEVHFEFSLRGGYSAPKQSALNLDYRSCDLAVLRTADYKYVHFQALPPILFDLREDPRELVDRSRDQGYREVMLEMAQRMLNWRMHNAERELTHLNASPEGLVAIN
jgi:arylsulfatase A-like enzyme